MYPSCKCQRPSRSRTREHGTCSVHLLKAILTRGISVRIHEELQSTLPCRYQIGVRRINAGKADLSSRQAELPSLPIHRLVISCTLPHKRTAQSRRFRRSDQILCSPTQSLVSDFSEGPWKELENSRIPVNSYERIDLI